MKRSIDDNVIRHNNVGSIFDKCRVQGDERRILAVKMLPHARLDGLRMCENGLSHAFRDDAVGQFMQVRPLSSIAAIDKDQPMKLLIQNGVVYQALDSRCRDLSRLSNFVGTRRERRDVGEAPVFVTSCRDATCRKLVQSPFAQLSQPYRKCVCIVTDYALTQCRNIQ